MVVCLVVRVKGSEAWSYDTVCALCSCIIGPDQDVYVVGMHVLHGECLEWLLKQPEHKFREVLKHLPLDTHEELKKLYAERKSPTTSPPGKPPEKPEEEVREFKNKLWVIFHGVEEHDWERLKLPESQKILGELREEARRLSEKKLMLYDWLIDPLETLKRAIDEKDAERALWAICRVLFWLDPPGGP
jgi:hypothetical protein